MKTLTLKLYKSLIRLCFLNIEFEITLLSISIVYAVYYFSKIFSTETIYQMFKESIIQPKIILPFFTCAIFFSKFSKY